ncbi:LemA family protein [Acidovorax sp. SUPP1855]|uniref:LemA family protein n=1 Tax=Acidovorax sp. SUPP1855 TaxID=431774 RepID=UPI0023DE1B05|nr:LemA family protein [Acidovorax sp. SUPP1855]GKS87265.1 LemA family protein [Acidovorax sp. SUPP1855]
MLSSWIFLALLLFWAVGAYNRIVRLRSAAIQAFGGLDAHLMRMMAMLGEYEAAQGPAPAAHADARAALWAATTQFGASLAVARARPLDAGAAAALLTGREVLEAAWLAMVRVAEVPHAPGEGAALPLWAQRWQELVAQNALATRQFNDAALQYNQAIGQFPARLLAWLFGFKAARTL